MSSRSIRWRTRKKEFTELSLRMILIETHQLNIVRATQWAGETFLRSKRGNRWMTNVLSRHNKDASAEEKRTCTQSGNWCRTVPTIKQWVNLRLFPGRVFSIRAWMCQKLCSDGKHKLDHKTYFFHLKKKTAEINLTLEWFSPPPNITGLREAVAHERIRSKDARPPGLWE